VRVLPLPGHDRECVRQRNALIPDGQKIASAKVAIERSDGETNAAWTRCLSIAMDTFSASQMVLNNQR